MLVVITGYLSKMLDRPKRYKQALLKILRK